jgi:NADH-quinone oxidoreductase subunit C
MHSATRDKLKTQFGDRLEEVTDEYNELAIKVSKEDIPEVVRFLRDDPELQYIHLSDITATDWPDDEKRHELIYHLYSYEILEYIRIKARVAEAESVPTLCNDWDCANWLEREVFDMFGVQFQGHPDLRRILMWEGFEGHPLRKDYPLTYERPQFSFNKDNPPEIIK